MCDQIFHHFDKQITIEYPQHMDCNPIPIQNEGYNSWIDFCNRILQTNTSFQQVEAALGTWITIRLQSVCCGYSLQITAIMSYQAWYYEKPQFSIFFCFVSVSSKIRFLLIVMLNICTEEAIELPKIFFSWPVFLVYFFCSFSVFTLDSTEFLNNILNISTLERLIRKCICQTFSTNFIHFTRSNILLGCFNNNSTKLKRLTK